MSNLHEIWVTFRALSAEYRGHSHHHLVDPINTPAQSTICVTATRKCRKTTQLTPTQPIPFDDLPEMLAKNNMNGLKILQQADVLVCVVRWIVCAPLCRCRFTAMNSINCTRTTRYGIEKLCMRRTIERERERQRNLPLEQQVTDSHIHSTARTIERTS